MSLFSWLSIMYTETYIFWFITLLIAIFLVFYLLSTATKWIHLTNKTITLHTLFKTKSFELAKIEQIRYNFKTPANGLKESVKMQLYFYHTDGSLEKMECKFIGYKNFLKLVQLYKIESVSLSMDLEKNNYSIPNEFFSGILVLIIALIVLVGSLFIMW